MTTTTADLEQRRAARQIWLHYYNNYLRDNGVISEDSWRRMRLSIDQGKPRYAPVRRGQSQPRQKESVSDTVEQAEEGHGAEDQDEETQGITMTML